MKAEAALARLGGSARRRALLALTTRGSLQSALRRGLIERTARGSYVVPDVTAHRRRASELAGVLSHLDAALHWGWSLKHLPDRAWVTVPRNRKVSVETQATTRIAYADLPSDQVINGVTSPTRTVLDCARVLPFDEALAVADSALRSGQVSREELLAVAGRARGPGAVQIRRVTREASPRAANPFESVLRAIVLEFPEFTFEAQGRVECRGWSYHPDLVDRTHRIVVEGDSWTYHGGTREAHERDCTRYTTFTAEGWIVLRFTWLQVMETPIYVRSVLREVSTLVGAAKAA